MLAMRVLVPVYLLFNTHMQTGDRNKEEVAKLTRVCSMLDNENVDIQDA